MFLLCYSVTKPCPTPSNPMNCSPTGFPVFHYLPDFAHNHVHCVSDAIQTSYHLSPPSPLALRSLPASGSFPMSRFFATGGQSIRASASASVLPVNIQGWFPLGWTGLISPLFKGLSRTFCSTTVWEHQFFGAQPSLRSNSYIHTWLLEKP